jgi:hypothetical protein
MAIACKIKETFTVASGCGMIYVPEKDKKHCALVCCHGNPSPDGAALRY